VVWAGAEVGGHTWRKLQEAMTRDEVKPLKDEYQTGMAGRLSAVSQLRALPYQTRIERAEAIKPGLSAIAVLPPATQEIALRGEEDIERVKDHFGERKAQAEFTRVLGVAGRAYAMDGEFEAAKAIYAFRAREKGVDKWDPILFQNSVREATGGVQSGGVWLGGLQPYKGTSRVMVPPGFSSTKFASSVATIPFESARIRGGARITRADALANYTPMLVEQGENRSFYEWIDASGQPLLHVSGGHYKSFMDH
jgi:hypothetical protein